SNPRSTRLPSARSCAIPHTDSHTGRNLLYGSCGSVTVGVGGSALVTGDASTGSGGGGGGGGAATVEVGSGDVDTGSLLAVAVEVALVTVCVTGATGVAALFAAFVTVCVAACVPGAVDGTALDPAATGPDAASAPVAPASCCDCGAGPPSSAVCCCWNG